MVESATKREIKDLTSVICTMLVGCGGQSLVIGLMDLGGLNVENLSYTIWENGAMWPFVIAFAIVFVSLPLGTACVRCLYGATDDQPSHKQPDGNNGGMRERIRIAHRNLTNCSSQRSPSSADTPDIPSSRAIAIWLLTPENLLILSLGLTILQTCVQLVMACVQYYDIISGIGSPLAFTPLMLINVFSKMLNFLGTSTFLVLHSPPSISVLSISFVWFLEGLASFISLAFGVMKDVLTANKDLDLCNIVYNAILVGLATIILILYLYLLRRRRRAIQ